MKSPERTCLAAFAAVTALVIAGCGHKDGDRLAHESGDAEPAHEAGVTFNAKQGLLVPPATAKFIGLQVADVEERKIAAAFHFSAQVYRAASETQFASLQPSRKPDALASGNVSPVDAAKLSEGQTVSVRRGDSGVALPGRIVTLKRDLEKASGQVEVLLAVSDAQPPLASGAFLSVTVPLGGNKNVLSVPRSALFRTTEGDFVYTVSGEHFIRTPVRLGVVNPEFAEVTDGLYAGDQIVVQAAMTLWLAELQSLRGGKACADGQ
jgi:multidrug efflux pump subunit AcrA (membrane-fusion protein)